MKQLLASLFVLFVVVQVKSQEKQIFTKSVQLEEFIPFIVNTYNARKERLKHHKITFLVPISDVDHVDRTMVILKQSFRLLSNRLQEGDRITLVGYSAINGILVNNKSPKELKDILLVLDDVKSNVSRIYKDGIQLGYDISENTYDESAINSLVMIRAPNVETITKSKSSNQKVKKEKKKRSNVVWMTLIGLAPEIISALKN